MRSLACAQCHLPRSTRLEVRGAVVLPEDDAAAAWREHDPVGADDLPMLLERRRRDLYARACTIGDDPAHLDAHRSGFGGVEERSAAATMPTSSCRHWFRHLASSAWRNRASRRRRAGARLSSRRDDHVASTEGEMASAPGRWPLSRARVGPLCERRALRWLPGGGGSRMQVAPAVADPSEILASRCPNPRGQSRDRRQELHDARFGNRAPMTKPCGVPDPLTGEIGAAFVELVPGCRSAVRRWSRGAESASSDSRSPDGSLSASRATGR